MKTIEEKINYYKESLDLFDDGMDKYKFLIDQGTNDDFIKLLRPHSLSLQFENESKLGKFRYQEGYDHSYFFVSTFIKDHIFYHAEQLKTN